MGNAERGLAQLDKLMLSNNGKVDFDQYMNNREDDTRKVREPKTYREELISHFGGNTDTQGKRTPWSKVDDKFLIRPSEVTLWHGYNGHGKSMVLGYLSLELAMQGERILVISLEMTPRSTLARMARQAIGTNQPTEQYLNNFIDWCDGKYLIFDQHGTVKGDRVEAVLYYAAEQLGCTQIILDSLMKCGYGEDDYNGQKAFVDRLCAFAMATGCHVHLVHHSRKATDEDKAPGKMDAKGSGAITDQVDNVVSVWRNKPKERDKSKVNGKSDRMEDYDCLLSVDKQRHFEWEGRVALWFDPLSLQYREASNMLIKKWI